LVDGGEEPAAAAEEAVVEDEFDLSEIMGEEVAGATESKEELLKKADEELQVMVPR
jgi:hypothetical protein